jgi:hypothetical protein
LRSATRITNEGNDIMPKPLISIKTSNNVKADFATTAFSVDKLTKTSVDAKIHAITYALGEATVAIDKKYAELNQAPGKPLGGVEWGSGTGFLRRYQNGIIFLLSPGEPCWVHGAILSEYLALDADRGFLGYPTTDERATPDGTGRYNHFERGSIYWTYHTGAHEIHGAIRDKWAALGWEKSWLGFPISGEGGFTENGRFSQFERGFIYWWPDAGAFDLGNVSLRYKGLYCFGETDFDGFSSADEPYAVLGTVPVPAFAGAEPGSSVRSQIYTDVDSGDSRPDDLELFNGHPHGIAFGATLFEHGTGDPNTYLGLIQKGVELAGKGVAAGCGALFGPEAASTCESLWGSVAPVIVSTLNDIAGTGERVLGALPMQISAKQMVMLARQPKTPFWGIEYHLELGLFSGYGSTYKMYFAVEPA